MPVNVLDILLRVKGANQAKSALQGLGGAAKELGLMIGLGGATAGIIAFGKQSFAMAGQAERLGRATNNLAKSIGASGEAMIQSMDNAAKGTISSVDAMRMANKAMLLDVVKNEEEMADLTRIAVVLGQAMGKDAASSVDDLTTALGRQSPLILDNLGIKMNLAEAEADYARMLGKTADQLDDTEKKQAFMTAAWEKARQKAEELGDVNIDTIGEIEQLTAAWADFQTEFGQFLTGSGVIPQITALVDKMTEGAKAWQVVFGAGEAGDESKKAKNLAIASTAFAALSPADWIASIFTGEDLGTRSSRYAQLAQDIGLVKFDTGAFQQEQEQANTVGQQVTATEAVTEATKEAAKAQYDYAGAMDAAKDLTKSLSILEIEHARTREQTIQNHNQRRAQINADWQRTQNEQLADYQRQAERQMRSFLKSQADAEIKYNEARMSLARDHGIEAERAEADHQKRMARMREDYVMRQEDAVAARDAMAFLRNAREYEVNRRRNEEDFGDQRAERQADYQRQLEDMQQAFAQQRDERLAQFQEQQQDVQADFDYRQARAAEHHQIEMDRFEADHQERLVELDQRLEEEKQAERQGFQERLTELEGFNDEFLALEKQRNAAAKAQLEQTLQEMRQQRARATYQPVHGRASGGYAGFGVYQLGEAGREFVLNASATQMAEGLTGGALNQDSVLAMLAAGRGAMNNFSQTVNIGGQDSYAGLLAAVRAQTIGLLNEYARG